MNATSATSILIVLNGKKSASPELRSAVAQLRKEGYTIAVRVTWEHGDALRFVHEAHTLKIPTVVAAGGDGTVNEVACAIAQLPQDERPALGILPLGTANDFARSCQIPEAPYEALSLIFKNKAMPIDLAVVNDHQYFINMATGGWGTKITTETPKKLKEALGGFSYLLHGLSQVNTLKPSHCTITAEGFQWSGEALIIAVGNGKQAGGGHQLCPAAKVDDGELELSVLMTTESLSELLSSLINEDDNNIVIKRKFQKLEISSQETMVLNLDGEPLKSKHYSIQILPKAIRCHLPPTCSLLSSS